MAMDSNFSVSCEASGQSWKQRDAPTLTREGTTRTGVRLSLSYSISHHQGLMVKCKAPGKSHPMRHLSLKDREWHLGHTRAPPRLSSNHIWLTAGHSSWPPSSLGGRGHTQDSVQGKYVGGNLLRECHFHLATHNAECAAPGGMLGCDEDRQ